MVVSLGGFWGLQGGPLKCLTRAIMGFFALCLLVDLADAGRGHIPRRLLQDRPLGTVGWAIIGAAIVVVIVCCVALYLSCRNTKPAAVTPEKPRKPSLTPRPSMQQRPSGSGRLSAPSALSFSIDQIKTMTNSFSEKNVIEDAGHASVYLGFDSKGNQVAVKRAKRVSREGQMMFKNEVAFLAHVKHKHVVQFLGGCDADQEQILVFEYLTNGSLASWLRPSGTENPPRKALSFAQRMRIAIDVAEALTFMHAHREPTIIHRDVKSDTILLDRNMSAKLGGVGLLKHLPGEAMRIRMDRKKGYLDPEYFQTFKVTTKCDVYAFGVVLLEMVSGRPPIIEAAEGDEEGNGEGHTKTLPQFCIPAILEEKVEAIVDPRMPISNHTLSLLTAFSQVAAACVAPQRASRPEMAAVLELLKGIKAKSEE